MFGGIGSITRSDFKENGDMKIQLFKPKYRIEECLKEIRECLEIGWTGLGFKTVNFEEAWKQYTGLKNAHYLNSSTIGLDMAVEICKMEYGWNDDDEIITTPITFVSTNHAILRNKMRPIFADVDNSLNLNPQDVRRKITKHKTKAVMFVGLGGNTKNLREIEDICTEYNLKLILDAAHMAGTHHIDGTLPGKDAEVIVYSFQAVKNCPTSDSGMICFKEKKLDGIVRKMSWLGIDKDTYARSVNKDSVYKWKYDVEYIGHKAHGNSVTASLGLVGLKYLDEDNAYRRKLAQIYDEEFKNDNGNIKLITIDKNCIPSRHLYQILVPNRDDLILKLNENGIYPGVHYRDNTEYRMYSYAKGTCPYAKYVSEHVLSLPLHLDVTQEDVIKIAKIVKDNLK